jgi:hypothetical protein
MELEADVRRRTVVRDVRGQCARQSCAGQSVDSGRDKIVEIRVRRSNHSLSCRLATHETPDSVGHATRSLPRDHTATWVLMAKALQKFWRVLRVVTGESRLELESGVERRTVVRDIR